MAKSSKAFIPEFKILLLLSRSVNCATVVDADWTTAGEGGEGTFEFPSFAVLAGSLLDVGVNPLCGQMYAIPAKDAEEYVYFQVAASEKASSSDLFIGEDSCALVGDETCESVVAVHLPELSSTQIYEDASPPKIGNGEATVCSGFVWETEGGDGSLANPRNAIITGTDDSFCGRVYQFGGEHFSIKAHIGDVNETGTIVVDQDSCDAACAEATCDPGCGVKVFPQYAGQLAATTPEPEPTTEDGNAVFAASFAFLALCLA